MQEVNVLSRSPELVIALSGEIDSKNADEFFGEVISAYGAAPYNLTFDCAALEFIDSTTLGTFVKILKRVKTDGKNMKLVNMQPRIKKMFVICALDTLMAIA